MIDGFSGFRNFESQLQSAPEDSPTIKKTTDVWAKFPTGELPTHDNVVHSITEINNLIECSGKVIRMGTFKCEADCIAVSQTPTYTVPACVSN